MNEPVEGRFEIGLHVGVELRATHAEDLESVVVEGIVGGRHHDTRATSTLGDDRHPGCGQHAQIHPGGTTVGQPREHGAH